MSTSSKSKRATLFAQIQAIQVDEAEPRKDAGKPRTAVGQFGQLVRDRDEAVERADKAEAELTAVRSSREAKLDDLHEVPGRRRNLPADKYAELKANIRSHGLSTPVSVRRREEGGFEIVSGHHRLDVFRELHAEDPSGPWSTIRIDVHEDSSEAIAEERAFYANLMHPSLPDYEKYLGLKKVQRRHPELDTARALASHVGMGYDTVTRLLKFEDLPEEALALIATNPKEVGARAVKELAALAAQGNSDAVVGAVQAIIAGEDQGKAVVAARTPQVKPDQQASRIKPETIKAGKHKYATLRAVKTTLRIDFVSEQEREEVETLVREMLEQRAKSKSS